MTLLPALLLVSWQFKMVQARFPHVQMGAYLDDRSYRGDLNDWC